MKAHDDQITQFQGVIYFNKVDINIGVNFGISDSKFNATQSGIYLFSFTATVPFTKYTGPVEIAVKRNGEINFVISDGSSQHGSNIAYTWMMDLNVGESLEFSVVEGSLQANQDNPIIFTAEFLTP